MISWNRFLVIRPFSDPPRIYGGQRLVATLEDSLKNGAGNGGEAATKL